MSIRISTDSLKLRIEGSRVSDDLNIYIVAEVHSLNRYSKGKRVYYGYSYG